MHISVQNTYMNTLPAFTVRRKIIIIPITMTCSSTNNKITKTYISLHGHWKKVSYFFLTVQEFADS